MTRAGALLAAALALTACGQGDVEARRRAVGPNPALADYLRVSDATRGARLFGRCAACHNVGNGAPDRNGPNLHAVMGRAIAKGSARFPYTGPLLAKQGVWTPEAMDAWLASPARFAPGTSMNFAGVGDPLDRADLIAFLQAQR